MSTQHFFHLPVKESNRKILTFRTDNGIYEYLRAPMGSSVSPSSWCQFISTRFADLDDFLTAYMDDLLIHSVSEELHLKHLEIVFERIRQENLKLKAPKCHFFTDEIKYIGNVISKEGLKIDDERIEAISKIPRPTTVTQVRSFLGMTGYLRKFIPHYSEISRPLVDLTRKRAIFQWSPEKEKAFQSLKSILKSNKVLKLFDVNQTSYLFTDASD